MSDELIFSNKTNIISFVIEQALESRGWTIDLFIVALYYRSHEEDVPRLFATIRCSFLESFSFLLHARFMSFVW